MLERLSKHTHFCFLYGYSGFSQIPVSQLDQEKTTFTCPFGTYAYRCMPFGLCNALTTFQRCMTAIFSDFCEKIVEFFMNDFSVYGKSFDDCLINLDRVLQRCEQTNIVLNWEKCHFMDNEGIVLGHKFLKEVLRWTKLRLMQLRKFHVLKISKVSVVSLVILVSIGDLSKTFLKFLGLLQIFCKRIFLLFFMMIV